MRITTLMLLVVGALALPGNAAAEARVDVAIEGGGTVTSPDGLIACAPTCSFLSGSSRVLQLTATPDSRSAFAGWEGCSGVITGNVCTLNAASAPDIVVCGPSGCSIMPVTAVYAVKAKFELAQRTLTVSMGGPGSGGILGSAGIDCGTACGVQVLDGTTVTLVAIPSADSVFDGWSGSCSGLRACVVNVTGGNHQVAATFSRAPRLVAKAHVARRATTGGTLRVRLEYESQGAVGPLRVTCRARIGPRRLAPFSVTRAAPYATCLWRVPPRTRGKFVRGTIGIRSGNLRAERTFTVRIR